MNIFQLILKFHNVHADINALLDGWIELSKEKGWPVTDEGLRRYLARLDENGGNIPRRPAKAALIKTIVPPPFVEWWKGHLESGYRGEESDEWTCPPLVAWRCLRYRTEWEQSRLEEAKAA